jgi:hypothetical protein
VERLYEDVRIPTALRPRLERVLRVEVAERERYRAEATEFLGRRLRQLANEWDKLLRAYYADAIDVTTLKREQARINAEVAEAESQLANDGEKLAQAKQLIDLALDLAKGSMVDLSGCYSNCWQRIGALPGPDETRQAE